MNYRLGLDIGIASIGYSVIETDTQGEPLQIKDLGVRIFDKAEQSKGGSLAEERRIFRGARRRVRRCAFRKKRVFNLIEKTFGKEIAEKSQLNTSDVYELRYRGLSEKLLLEEVGRLLLYFVKHRGFLSNRKAESQTKEGGKLLKATSENSARLKELGYRTIGEMLYKDEKYFHYENGKKIYTTRNKEDSYENCFMRNDIKAEILIILETQQCFGTITKDFIEEYIEIFYNNRNFDEGPGAPSKYRGGFSIGSCSFIKGEQCAPKSSYTFEYCTALQKINNLKVEINGNSRSLTETEKGLLYDLAKTKKELTFASVKKTLSLEDGATFNLVTYSNKKPQAEIEKKTKLFSMQRSYEIRKELSTENANNIDLLDSIADILSKYKSDDRRTENLKLLTLLSEEEIESLLSLNCVKFAKTSIKFLKQILPYLEQGKKYSDACSLAGFDHSNLFADATQTQLLNTKEVFERVQEIKVPVVKRAVSQTIKVINAIIIKYGSPIAINIELSRDLSKTFEERRAIEKENQARAQDNESIIKLLKTEFGIVSPTGKDILVYRLCEEQGGKCAYSLKPIDKSRLFEPNYVQVDHIVPYSKSFDDSFNNKVLVLTKENQDKRNRLPYEYFGGDENKWQAYENFVLAQYRGNRAKTQRLLKKKFTEEDAKAWKERNLNDTKYITSVVHGIIKDHLLFKSSSLSQKKKVIDLNGKITSYLRKVWGLNKVREDGDKHHALDATVIACVTDGLIQKITKFHQNKERFIKSGGNYTDYETGEIITEQVFLKELGGMVKQPYEGFSKELTFRLANDPKYYLDFFIKQGYSDQDIDALSPIFVSRMSRKKKTGSIHKATIRSAKHYDEQGIVVTRVSLKKLSLNKEKTEIVGYYRKEDDKLLYQKLLSTLIAFGGDAEKAFENPVYKPKSDGTNGNIVRSVKIAEKQSLGVKLTKNKGFAANDSMYRIDVFSKNGKYYAIPVYMSDVYINRLPNKAVVSGKLYEEWQEIDNTFEFLYSLYYNDAVYISHKNGIKFTKTNSNNKDDVITLTEGYFYFVGININTGAINLIFADNSYVAKSVGLKTLQRIEKLSVDYLGNILPAPKENRGL